MHKETITYVDYNGEKRTETHFFNLTQAELVELQMGVKGGLMEKMKEALKNEDSPVLMKSFRDIIRKSYGEKSMDGKHFIKFKIIDGVRVELADMFEQSPAYSELFMKLFTNDDDACDKFMRGVIPSEMANQLPADTKDALPDELKEIIAAQN